MYDIVWEIASKWEAQYANGPDGNLLPTIVQAVDGMNELQQLLRKVFIKGRACQYNRYQFDWNDRSLSVKKDLVNLLTAITCETSQPAQYWILCNDVLQYANKTKFGSGL